MSWHAALRHLGCVLVVTAAVTFLYSDLLTSASFWSHEKFYVYMRADQVAKELEAGHYPQAFPDAVYGAGFAFPRFYPPFSLWLSAGLTLLVGDAVLGSNLAFFLSVLASGLSMYLMVAALAREKLVAVAASLLYVSVPYRFVDVFVRGALAESWTFFWYPLVFLGLWRAITKRVFPWYLPVSVAGLVLTHNITAIYFLGFCALVAAVGFFWNGWRAAILPAVGLALGLGLSAWFLVPQQVYMKDVWVSDRSYMWADAEHVHEHRVIAPQFLFSAPDFWHGESQRSGYIDRMSFELGPGQLLVIPLAAGFLWLFARQRRRFDHLATVLAMACFTSWLVALAFMVYPRIFLALLPAPFAYIQFPWRLLALSIFLSATASALLVRYGGFSRRVGHAFAAAVVLTVALVPAFQREAPLEPDWTSKRILDADHLREEGALGFTVLGEYLPRDFDVEAIREATVDTTRFERPRLVGESAGAAITSWHRSGLDMEATIDGETERSIVFPVAYYDFYTARGANGLELETFSSEGMLGVRVPAGVGEVAVRQRITPVMKTGMWGSAFALVATFALALLVGWRERGWFRSRARRGREIAQPELGPAAQPLDVEQEV